MPANTRIGDPFTCGDTSAAGSGDVFINGIPQTRIGDATAGHPCGPPTTNLAGSTSTVFANAIPVCRVGDPLTPHGTCSGPPHQGVFAAGSPNVFTDSGGGAGAIIDNNPQFRPPDPPPPATPIDPGVPPSPGANPNNFEVSETDVYVYENNDDADSDVGNPAPPNSTAVPFTEVEDDPTPAPTNPPPTQDCSTVDALAANFNWATEETFPGSGVLVYPTFSSFANSFALSANYTVADMCYAAVSYYEFSGSVTQASGLTQKQILLNMCHHAKTVLEPLRSAYGTSFTITSGFRNKSGGSQHNKGQATDIQFIGFHSAPNTGELYYARSQEIRDNQNFDQMILEWFGRNPWIHISSNPATHRNAVLTQVSSSSYSPGLKLLSKA